MRIILLSLTLALCSTITFASCDSGACSPCDPYVNTCQCTDPYCWGSYRTCMSAGTCCEAFGNIGAR